MNYKNLIIALVVIVVVAVGFGMFGHQKSVVSFGNAVPINAPLKSGGVLCGTTSTLLMATSTSGRNFATITNIGSTIVYLGFGYSAADYSGTALAASGGTIVLDSTKTYTGAIYCISPTAASTTYSDSNS